MNESSSITKYLTTKWLAVLLIFVSFISTANPLQTGDLIFQRSASAQSQAISLITQSQYTHMGIIIIKQEQPYVFEAVSTVKLTPLKQWIKRGINNHYVIKRLSQPIDKKQQKKLIKIMTEYQGKRYDTRFEWSDKRIYCSELVWKMYDNALGIKLGKLQKIKEFDLSHPLVQHKITEYFSNTTIPLDETVITPISMFNSPLLITVIEN